MDPFACVAVHESYGFRVLEQMGLDVHENILFAKSESDEARYLTQNLDVACSTVLKFGDEENAAEHTIRADGGGAATTGVADVAELAATIAPAI